MENIMQWNHVLKEGWSYTQTSKHVNYLIYKVNQLPNFTDARFLYLSKEADNRSSEVAKKQMQMIRQFHGLGEQWGISLRFIKDESITLYLVFRCATNHTMSKEELDKADSKIRNALMQNEYTFKKVEDDEKDVVFDLSWCNEAVEISKFEEKYRGDNYPVPNLEPREFYAVSTWTPTDNNMEHICLSLMNHKGKGAVEVTIIPTTYLSDEKSWIDTCINDLKECMNGETIRDPRTNRVLWTGKKLPTLKNPMDTFDKMNKQYVMSHLFLSSIRVFSNMNAEVLGSAFLTNSVRNKGNIITFRKGSKQFEYLEDCYRSVDISAQAHSFYWNVNRDQAPYRAQRLNRLVSVEEIGNFFRIPIPTKSSFPGFALDTGLKTFVNKKKTKSKITLGTYLDIPGVNDAPASFDVQQMAKHGLIVGVPGSGKTTAMFNILYQLWAVPEEQRIPFIILEPAKTEYRALKTLPEFKDDLLVFTLGDESVSPFRFNPMEVLPGIRLENHISRLQACFVGAFDLFDPLPIFLEQAIRRTYLEKGWYDDSRGGDEGVETPTLSDLCRNAEYIISNSGFDAKMKSDFQASLLERLNSLRRGSKGRMLDTKHTIPMEDLMNKPVVMELDSLNGSEKSLMMMFLLSYVFEYCKVQRKSGSPLKHMLLVEEAHNLIGSQGGGSENRADPKAQTIELFTNMLAEMRALGQGILIADQLPTAIAPQAVKQTNVKILMRVTAKDDREEIGNSMDLNEEQMHQVVNFKTGHAYVYHEGEDHVRMLRMLNFKGEHDVEEPPIDAQLKVMMQDYELTHPELYYPYPQCSGICKTCNRRTRNQAESFVKDTIINPKVDLYGKVFNTKYKDVSDKYKQTITFCSICNLATKREKERIMKRYGNIGPEFGACVYIHFLNLGQKVMGECKERFKVSKKCICDAQCRKSHLDKFKDI